SRWRLYDPTFQAALNARRAEVWAAGADRLRSLIPKALDTLADELENKDSPNRLKAACELLKLAQPPGGAPGGRTDPEGIVQAIVKKKRNEAHGTLDALMDDGKGLPAFDKHVQETWRELEALVNEPEPTEEQPECEAERAMADGQPYTPWSTPDATPCQ